MSVVYIDRRASYGFPDWVLQWEMHDLQNNGPESINLKKLGAFTNPQDQHSRLVTGRVLFAHLRQSGLITNCLNIQDAKSLMADSIFRKPPFTGTRTLLWKSTVLGMCRNLYVPYIQNIFGQTPIIYYYWLEYQVNLDVHWGLLNP